MNHYKFEDLYIGQTEAFRVDVTEEKMAAFRDLSGDINPLHTDSSFAKKAGFQEQVVYGMLTASFCSTLAGVWLPGENSLIRSVELDFPKPVYVGDKLLVSGEIREKNEDYRFITVKVTVRNEAGAKVCRGKLCIGLLQ